MEKRNRETIELIQGDREDEIDQIQKKNYENINQVKDMALKSTAELSILHNKMSEINNEIESLDRQISEQNEDLKKKQENIKILSEEIKELKDDIRNEDVKIAERENNI